MSVGEGVGEGFGPVPAHGSLRATTPSLTVILPVPNA